MRNETLQHNRWSMLLDVERLWPTAKSGALWRSAANSGALQCDTQSDAQGHAHYAECLPFGDRAIPQGGWDSTGGTAGTQTSSNVALTPSVLSC